MNKKISKTGQNLINKLFFAGIDGRASLARQSGWGQAEFRSTLIKILQEHHFSFAEICYALNVAEAAAGAVQDSSIPLDEELISGTWYMRTNVTVALLLEKLSFFFED